MTPVEAIDALGQLAQSYLNTQTPIVRNSVGPVAQHAINVLLEATKEKPVAPAPQPPDQKAD